MAGLVVCTLVAALIVAGATGSSAADAPGGRAGTGTPAADAAERCAPDWVTAWQASPQAASGTWLGGRTLRMLVYPTATGSEVRVRLSNRYGSAPLVVGAVAAARSAGSAAVVPGSARRVEFAGRGGVVVPPGSEVLSDPVPLLAEAGAPLAVSVHLPVGPPVVAEHPVALQTSYLSRPGDHALADGAAPFGAPVRSWAVLTGVDVLAPRPVNALVAVGDSITDGVGSPVDAGSRWTDALAERLATAGGADVMAVLNAGISGNRLLDGAVGEPPLERFDADVARAAGVSDVLLHIGTNDIAAGRGAPAIVDGLVRFTERAHRAGLRVLLTTVTPSSAGAHGTRAAVAVREAVNAWVRVQGPAHAEGVVDFAAAVADPADPTRLAPAFDAGDGLHLSTAGYRALASAVPVDGLSGSPCRAGDAPERVLVSGGAISPGAGSRPR